MKVAFTCYKVLEGHESSINALAITPNGKYLVSGSGDRTIRIWNTETGALVHTLLGHSDQVYSIDISPDGKYILSGANDFRLKVWDLDSGNLFTQLDLDFQIGIARFTCDGMGILVSTHDPERTIWHYQFESMKLLRKFVGHELIVNCLLFSHDQNLLYSGSDDCTVRCWDWITGVSVVKLRDKQKGIDSICLSSDDRYLAVAAGIQNLVKFDLHKTLITIHFPLGIEGIRQIALSSDNQYLIGAVSDGTLRVWDFQSGDLLQILEGHTRWVNSVLIGKGDQIVFSGAADNTICVWKRV